MGNGATKEGEKFRLLFSLSTNRQDETGAHREVSRCFLDLIECDDIIKR